MNHLFERFDAILKCRGDVIQYADTLSEPLHDAENNAAKKVITTLGYDLGIVCPSLVRHIVIGNHKKGRIIKTIPEGKSYQIISYDAENQPIAFRNADQFGIKDAYFFFNYQGYMWAVEMNQNGCTPYTTLYRMEYDKQGRILSFYSIDSTSLIGEEYHYQDGKPIECFFYYYVPNRVNTSKDVPAGYEESPMTLYHYLIHKDTIDGYIKSGETFRFEKTYRRTKSIRKVSPEKQFTEQLDTLLENADLSAANGIYFELHEGNALEYEVYVDLTSSFDENDENWACYTDKSLGLITMTKQRDMEWDEIQDATVAMVQTYLKQGKHRNRLLTCAGIGVGFPDGDIVICKS